MAELSPTGIVWRATDGTRVDPRQVKDVETTSRGRGLLQGMGIGLASGVAVGGAVRVACPYDPDDAVTSWAIR